MPRSWACRRSRTERSSTTSPHQPVETVHTPKPTSETAMSVLPSFLYFIFAPSLSLRAAGQRPRSTTFYRRSLSSFSQQVGRRGGPETDQNLWPGGQAEKRKMFLTRNWRAFTLQVARADQLLQSPSNPLMGGGEEIDDDDPAREDPRGHPRGRGPGHRRDRASPREGGQDPQPAGRAGDHASQGPVQAAGPGYGCRVARHDVDRATKEGP